jgi:ABC-type transport system substrate-binding protein
LSKELYDYSMFATRYLFFDTNVKPWNDKKVREAVTRALDGQTMINVIYGGLGSRAYGLLPPGFPSYQKGLNDEYQGYDPEKAKSLLEAAGYPGGKGFPVVTLWHKTYEPSLPKTAQIVQQMLKQNLGITVELKPATTKFFHSSLVEGLIDFGVHNWQYEYLDPSNFLTIFVPELGRHKDWNDSEYNRLIKAANASPNQAERLSMYTHADSLISRDYAASFLYHMGNAQMWKPYIKGIPMTDLGTQNVVYYFLGMHKIYKAGK